MQKIMLVYIMYHIINFKLYNITPWSKLSLWSTRYTCTNHVFMNVKKVCAIIKVKKISWIPSKFSKVHENEWLQIQKPKFATVVFFFFQEFKKVTHSFSKKKKNFVLWNNIKIIVTLKKYDSIDWYQKFLIQ